MITINFETGDVLDIDKKTLKNSVLAGFDFHRAVFDEMNIEGVDFRSSKLRGTSLRKVNASFANFSGVPLMTSNFYKANLAESIFIDSRVMYADFTGSNLSKSDMTDADVLGAVFKDADLKGVVMLCQNLDKADLGGSFYNVKTVWPEGFDPLTKGAILIDS